MFWASPECSLPRFQALLAQILASVSFWLITEQAECPGIDVGVTSCKPGMGEIMAQKSRLRRLRASVEKDSTRSDAQQLQQVSLGLRLGRSHKRGDAFPAAVSHQRRRSAFPTRGQRVQL